MAKTISKNTKRSTATKTSATKSIKSKAKRSSSNQSTSRNPLWNTSAIEETYKKMYQNFPQNASNISVNSIQDKVAQLTSPQNFAQASQFNKENMDAALRSTQVLAKATEELGKAIYSFTQSSMELSVQASQAALNIRTLQDLVDVQSEYARNSMDHLISGTSKISDMAVKVANEVMEPFNQRINDSIEKVSKAA